MITLPALLLAAAAAAQTQPLPEFPGAAMQGFKDNIAAMTAALAETPEERERHAASLTWPGGPRSTYRAVVDPANRRAGDPARDIVGLRWPNIVTRLWYLEGNVEKRPLMIEGNVSGPWSDSSDVISRLTGRPAIISPEYIAFRMGASALVAPAVYGTAVDMPPFETGRDAAHPWLHLVQFTTDSRGDDCVSLNRVGRAVSGCGDLWQDGIDPANELACFEGRTYLRCHLWCAQQTLNRPFNHTNGPCP